MVYSYTYTYTLVLSYHVLLCGQQLLWNTCPEIKRGVPRALNNFSRRPACPTSTMSVKNWSYFSFPTPPQSPSSPAFHSQVHRGV